MLLENIKIGFEKFTNDWRCWTHVNEGDIVRLNLKDFDTSIIGKLTSIDYIFLEENDSLKTRFLTIDNKIRIIDSTIDSIEIIKMIIETPEGI